MESRVHEIGQNRPRIDGRDKVVGTARYIDDFSYPGMWYGATVRSPHPRAQIERIDARRAQELDPEVIVLTAAELPGPNVVRLIEDDWPVLAAAQVEHVGQAVALVAAPTRERAARAAALIEVSYRELPAILTLDQALAGDPRTDGDLNVLAVCQIELGDVEAGLRESDLVIEGQYETGLQEHIYIETNGMIALPGPAGSVEVLGSMQCPYYVQKAVGHLLGKDPDRVRVRQVETGGGFGGKEDYPDMIGGHAALLALAAGRPVKIIYDRHEDIIATTKRHPSRVRHRTGVRRDGLLVAIEIDVLLDGGAFTTLSPVVLSRGVIHAAGPYRCPNVRIRGQVLATNTAPNGAFRGFGAPQTQFAAERQMDRVARAVGLDPLTIRERNAYRPGDVTPTGQVLDESVSALDCLREVESRTRFRQRWSEREAARADDPDDGRPLSGIGISLVWHGAGFTGNGERKMRSPVLLRLAAGGTIEVAVAATEFGQGTRTVLTQIVADAVGVARDQVVVLDQDTQQVPDSGPTVASRTVMVVGGLLVNAGEKLAAALLEFAAASKETALGCRFVHGRLLDPAGAEVGAFAEIAQEFVRKRGPLEITERFEAAPGDSFDETTYRGNAYASYGWGCDVVEVEVNPDTLATTLVRATLAYDVGRAIHPKLCRGQVEGGSLQAFGQGILEEIKMEGGRYLNDRLATYIIPTIRDTPDMETILIENPAPTGPLGAKGVGEIPMDGGAAAVLAAIENATGIIAAVIPATPERLLQARSAGQVVAVSQVKGGRS